MTSVLDERSVPRETPDPLAAALVALARAVIATDPGTRRAKMTVIEGTKREEARRHG